MVAAQNMMYHHTISVFSAEGAIGLGVLCRDPVRARKSLVQAEAAGVPHDVVVGEHPRGPGVAGEQELHRTADAGSQLGPWSVWYFATA